MIQSDGSSIGWIDEQVNIAGPFLPGECDGLFDQALFHTLTAYLGFDSNTNPPARDWLIRIVGFDGDGPQLLPGRIGGHKGWIALLFPTAPILLFDLSYGFNAVMR